MKTPATSDIAAAAAQTAQAASAAASQAAEQAAGQASKVEQRLSAGTSAALDQWAELGKAQLGAGLALAQSLVKGAQALRQVQLEAGQQAEQRYQEAQARLSQARDVGDLFGLQAQLLRSHAESALQYWTSCFDAAHRTRAEAASTAAAALGDLQKAALSSAQQWAGRGASAAQGAVGESTRAWGGNGLAWPAPDAARSALSWATSAWDQWLSQANQWQRAAGQAGAEQRSVH